MLEAQTLKEARNDPRRSGPSPGILLHDGARFNGTIFESRAGGQRASGLAAVAARIFRTRGGGGGGLQFLAGLQRRWLKNDRVDSHTLAHLLRCDLLPAAWMADRATREKRQLVRLRISLGQHRASFKNQAHAILHQHGLRPPVSDAFGKKGRAWLKKIPLPAMARGSLDTYCALIDEVSQHIQVQDRQIGVMAQGDQRSQWLATIPGIGKYSAMILLAEIGEVQRFPTAKALFSYAGLVPWVRESAGKKSRGGISRCGSPRLRWVMVEAAHTAVRCSPAARRYFEGLRRRTPACGAGGFGEEAIGSGVRAPARWSVL